MRTLQICILLGQIVLYATASDPETIDALVQALNSSNISSRRAAALKIGQVRANTVEALEALGKAAQDSDEILACRAIGSLSNGFHNRERQMEILLSIAKSENLTVRIAAMETLSRWNRPADLLIPAFLNAMKEESSAIRTYAAKGLARLDLRKLPNAKAQLLVAMQPLLKSDDYSPQLAGATALAYHQLDVQNALPILIKLLDGPDRQTRRDALTAIERYGELGKPAIEALLLHMEAGDDHHRRTIGRTILRVDPENGIYLLTEVLKKSKSQHARTSAVEALGTLPTSEVAFQSLSLALKDRSSNVRYYSCLALQNFPDLDDPTKVNLRHLARQDRSSIIRETALETLAMFQ